MGRILFFHEWITGVFYFISGLGIVFICALYTMEVVLRYFLNSPTDWSTDLIVFLLLISTFSAVPHAVRSATHVAVTLVIDKYKDAAPVIGAGINIVGLVLCAFVGYIALDSTIEQYVEKIETLGNLKFSKWILTAFIAYGFLCSALWHLRFLLTGQLPIQSEVAAIVENNP